ncbi:transcriptional regulator, partial [Acinetobacter baumannii]|nr:transcriptional regulator [Acinetobacter baumannii]
SLYDIYLAVGEPSIFAIGNQNEEPNCLVEVVVNRSLDQAFINAQQILISNLKATTLAQLAHEFQIEWDQHIANK